MTLHSNDPTQEKTAQSVAGFRLTRRSLFAAGVVVTTALTARGSDAAAMVGEALKKGKKPKPGNQCFLRGTAILTPQGEVEISTLQAGDLVMSGSGAAKPVVRVQRTELVRAAGQGWSIDDLPVVIERHAFDAQTPNTDLYVTRRHSLYIDGMLVPVQDLINGKTIRSVERMDADTIEYFHLALADHDILIAAGLACESLLDHGKAVKGEAIVPFAPIVSFQGGRGALASRLRSAMSPLVDRRTHLDVVRDRLEDRAFAKQAA